MNAARPIGGSTSPGPARALTSSVSGRVLALTTCLVAAAVVTVTMERTSLPTAAKALLVTVVVLSAVLVVVAPARVSVGINSDGVRYRRATGQTRWIPAEMIAAAEPARVAYGAILGWGIRPTRATDRRIVRAGWALHLRLRTREEIWLSTRGPLHAYDVLAHPQTTLTTQPKGPASMSETNQNKPWFGNKRIGFGLRPQTWQGWAIVIAAVLVIIVAAQLLS